MRFQKGSYARERAYLEEELRLFVYKTHRVVFHVDRAKSAVYVLYVRHGKRRAEREPEEIDEK